MKAYIVSANHLADGKWMSLSPRAVLGGLEDAELAAVKARNMLIKAQSRYANALAALEEAKFKRAELERLGKIRPLRGNSYKG